MRYWFICMLTAVLLTCSLPVQAKEQGKDPFYPNQSSSKNLKINIPKLINEQFCPQAKKGLVSNIEFDQLKVVGVVNNQQGYKVLLMDENNHFIELKKNDFVAHQRMQLTHIQLGLIQFKYWDYALGCDHSQLISMQF